MKNSKKFGESKMDDKKLSLYSQYLKLIESDGEGLTVEEQEEWQRLQKIQLPPLNLPVTRPSFLDQYRQIFRGWKVELTMTAMALLAVFVFLPSLHNNKNDLSPKGALSVTVFFERDGIVKPLVGDLELQDGDKVGAQVISSEESIAYWVVTDKAFQVISNPQSIVQSAIILKPGEVKSFANSFELLPPNQGEQLVIAVCKDVKISENFSQEKMFNRGFVSDLMKQKRLNTDSCVFVGYRLRGQR